MAGARDCGNRSTPSPRQERARQGRAPTPSAAIPDSQSVKTTERGRHGYDGAKKINGRKRHLLVDTLGLVIKVQVTAADIGDRDGAAQLLRRLDRRRFPGCGTAGPMAATAACSWTGRPSAAASPSRSCNATMAGGSDAGYRARGDATDPVPVDEFGQVIDVFVSVRRDTTAARRFFQRASGTTRVAPVEVVTGRAATYPKVLEELLPAVQGLGKVPECRFHGLVMPSSGRTRVASRALLIRRTHSELRGGDGVVFGFVS